MRVPVDFGVGKHSPHAFVNPAHFQGCLLVLDFLGQIRTQLFSGLPWRWGAPCPLLGYQPTDDCQGNLWIVLQICFFFSWSEGFQSIRFKWAKGWASQFRIPQARATEIWLESQQCLLPWPAAPGLSQSTSHQGLRGAGVVHGLW